MTTLNTIIEEEKKEFDERFGNLLDPDTDRWLCQYNEHLGYSDHHLEVRTFLTTAMQRAYEAGEKKAREEERERIHNEVVFFLEPYDDSKWLNTPTREQLKNLILTPPTNK